MQRNVLLLFAIGVISSIAIAQTPNSSPYWSLAGNSNATTTSKLGTTNAISLNLATKNAIRATIDSNGNFGIGKTAPKYRLHVEGSGNQAVFVNTSALSATGGSGATGAVKQLPTAAGQRLGFFLFGSRGGGESQLNSAGMTGFAAAAWTSASRPTYLTLETTLLGSTSRTEQMRITEYGGVCIGTTVSNSNAKLNIDAGSRNVGIYLKTTGSYGMVSDGASQGINSSGSYSGVLANGGTYGVLAYGDYGLYGYGSSYGVYGYAYSVGGYAGYFSGNVYTTGTYLPSDRTLKGNIEELGSAMETIARLKPKSYEYRQDGNFGLMNLPAGKQYGFVAQDLEAVLPNLVKESHFNTRDVQAKERPLAGLAESTPVAPKEKKGEQLDFKAVNYTGLIPLIVKGMQEQDEQIKVLKKENESLKMQVENVQARMQKLEALLGNDKSTLIKLSGAYLEGSVPNPARGTTAIRYGVPDGATNARLTITSVKGQVIKELSLSTRGAGEINVNTANLASGVYTYTLWVNGQKVDSKQLVVAR